MNNDLKFVVYGLIMLLSLFGILAAGSFEQLQEYGSNAVTVARLILFFIMAMSLVGIIDVLSKW